MFGQKICTALAWAGPALCLLVLLSARAHADLQISGYQDRLHDPFYVGVDKAFIGAKYDWSGVGRMADPTPTGPLWKTVVMISDNYFVTANHNQPNRGNDPAGPAPKVRFYRTTDPQGEYWESEIAVTGTKYQGQRIGLTDLWVGKLATTPPDWVTRYPLAKRHEATNYLSYIDNEVFIFGQDSPRGWTGVRVGKNEVNQVDIGGNLQWDYNPANGLGANEAETETGDSGSPSFYTVAGGGPVLAGVHTRTNFDTGVSTQLDEIAAAIGEPISRQSGLLGDFNGDFQVNHFDFALLASGFGPGDGSRYYQGDINADGKVDETDFTVFLGQMGRSLYAPADRDQDGKVDGIDLATIGNSWLKSVTPFTRGDANGDGLVNQADVVMFDNNQFRAFFGALPAPLAPVVGDLTGNGVVDGFDLSMVTQNLSKIVVPGTNGDADGNGVVNEQDVVYVTTRLGSSFGDINGDRVVGPDDFYVMVANWNRAVSGGRLKGDFNNNGLVNTNDAVILFSWWGQQGGEFPGMLIPEPAAAFLVLQALCCLLPRRRCR